MLFLAGLAVGGMVAGKNEDSGSLAGVAIAIMIWFKVEQYFITNYSDKFIPMLILFLLMSILIGKFAYRHNNSTFKRWAVYELLKLAIIPICLILGIVMFNKIGNTLFSFFIDKFNMFHWKGEIISCIGEILGAICWLLDKALRYGLFIWLQRTIENTVIAMEPGVNSGISM